VTSGHDLEHDRRSLGEPPAADLPRPDIGSRRARWVLTLLGALLLTQALAKALDPAGYMAALARFDIFPSVDPHTFAGGAVGLGAVALAFTAAELFAGVAMLTAGLSNAPSRRVSLAGVVTALGLTGAMLALQLGALVRGLAIDNVTRFGSYLGQSLSGLSVAQDACIVVLLAVNLKAILGWSDDHEPAHPEETGVRPRVFTRPRDA
jgi:hypothetical protein